MTKLEAPPALLKRFRRMRETEGVHAFIRQVEKASVNQRLPAKRRVATKSEPKSENIGLPTVQRSEKAVEVSASTTPPFNSQILGAAQKFAKQLGPDTMIILEQLYRIGSLGNNSRGLTASYDGFKVDVSRSSYEHLGAAERDAHEQFLAAMRTMPIELRRYVSELVFEDVGVELSEEGKPPRRFRTPEEIGMEVTGYTDKRRAIGATVALLKVIAWCVQPELGRGRRK